MFTEVGQTTLFEEGKRNSRGLEINLEGYLPVKEECR